MAKLMNSYEYLLLPDYLAQFENSKKPVVGR